MNGAYPTALSYNDAHLLHYLKQWNSTPDEKASERRRLEEESANTCYRLPRGTVAEGNPIPQRVTEVKCECEAKAGTNRMRSNAVEPISLDSDRNREFEACPAVALLCLQHALPQFINFMPCRVLTPSRCYRLAGLGRRKAIDAFNM
jgi:hypothetical protein